VILYVILKYINSFQKKPIIKDTRSVNKINLGHNNEFYYDDGGNDADSYPEHETNMM
jgi:hypothetical protein